MKNIFGAVLLVVLCSGAGYAQPDEFERQFAQMRGSAVSEADPELDAMMPVSKIPQIVWFGKVTVAKSPQEKLTLLREAWRNYLDETLSPQERRNWHVVWLEAYKQASKEASMPNPYSR